MNKNYIFIDRDDTLIIDKEYLSDPAGVEFPKGSIAGLKRLRDAGYGIILITNQSGIGRGYFTEDDLAAVHRRLKELLANEGLENTDISDVTSETVGERPTEANLPAGVTFAGATLTATSETATTLFFKSNKPLTFKYNGQEMETKISGDYQTCTIKGIKSNFIDRYLTLEVSDGTENGTIKYNPRNSGKTDAA